MHCLIAKIKIYKLSPVIQRNSWLWGLAHSQACKLSLTRNMWLSFWGATFKRLSTDYIAQSCFLPHKLQAYYIQEFDLKHAF